jgi:hypothetical protein
MLRNVLSRTQIADSFVCWQCRARTQRNILRGQSRRTLSRSARIESSATLRNRNSTPYETSTPSGIREYLRQWQIHNGADVPMKEITSPTNLRTNVSNDRGNIQTRGALEAEEDDESHGDIDGYRTFLKDDLVDVGGRRTFLLPGDLVELA